MVDRSVGFLSLWRWERLNYPLGSAAMNLSNELMALVVDATNKAIANVQHSDRPFLSVLTIETPDGMRGELATDRRAQRSSTFSWAPDARPIATNPPRRLSSSIDMRSV